MPARNFSSLPDNGHFAAVFYPMLSIFHENFQYDYSPIREITICSKQCMWGPRSMIFQNPAQVLTCMASNAACRQKRKNDRPARTAVSAFSLDGATSPYPFDRDCVSGCAPKSALHANRHPLKFSERLLCESVKTQFV